MMNVHALALGLVLLCEPGIAGAASAEQGHALFLSNGCWQCHGTAGQGTSSGPRLAPAPLDVDALTGFVHSSNGDMPPYRPEILTDETLADIHAYLTSIPAHPAVASLPLDTFPPLAGP